MKKLLLVLHLCALFLMSCKKDTPFLSPEKAMLAFKISTVNNVKNIRTEINCVINDTLIVGVTGNLNSKTEMISTFTTTGETVTVNGVLQESGITVNDFTKPVVYVVKAKDGSEHKYTVKLKNFTGLPVVNITTDAAILSKEDYVNGSMKIDGNMDFTEGLYNGKIEIRGRGNSTWFQEKKPYKIKLDKKSTILGMPADKEWALLANYFDKSLIRNDIAFELSERIGMAWTPRRRFVEVILNGEYIGNYLLTETVKTGTDRLNITLMDKKNPSDTTSGFLVEADSRLEGDQWFRTMATVPLVLKEPEPASGVQLKHMQNRFQSMEDNISTYQDMRNQIDLDSWIKWVIVNEIMRNRDAVLFGSCFLYGKNNKIFFGPVWDFDLSSGGYESNTPEGWYVHTASWIGGMFLYHPYYKERFKQIWSENFSSIASIKDYIKTNNSTLQYSQKENFNRWDILNKVSYDGQIVSGSYKNEVDQLSGFLTKRINWINTQVNAW